MKKTILFGFGGALLLALLAGAAFMGMRLVNARASSVGPVSLLLGGNSKPGDKKVGLSIQLTPAAELPQSSPDFVGEVSSIQDNSISVVQQAKSGDGPTIEVVVTKETVIYRDTTTGNNPKPPASATSNIGMQQTVELADISQIAQGIMVQVWGPKRGDRLIADVILVMGPVVIKSKNPGQ